MNCGVNSTHEVDSQQNRAVGFGPFWVGMGLAQGLRVYQPKLELWIYGTYDKNKYRNYNQRPKPHIVRLVVGAMISLAIIVMLGGCVTQSIIPRSGNGKRSAGE